MEKTFEKIRDAICALPYHSVKTDSDKPNRRTIVFYTQAPKSYEHKKRTNKKLFKRFKNKTSKNNRFNPDQDAYKFQPYSYWYLVYYKKTGSIALKFYNYSVGVNKKQRRYYPNMYLVTKYVLTTKNIYKVNTFNKNGIVKNGDAYPLLAIFLNTGNKEEVEDVFIKTGLNINHLVFQRDTPGKYSWTLTKQLPNMWAYKWKDAKTLFEPLEKKYGVKIPKALHRFNPDTINILLKVLRNPNQLNWLCQVIKKVDKQFNFKEQRRSLSCYLALNTNPESNYTNHHRTSMYSDWIRMAEQLKVKINLNASFRRVQEQHDEFARAIKLDMIPEIEVKETYRKLLENEFPYPITLIDSKKLLAEEGTRQKHCVASYGQKINSGRCAIFTMEYEGENYTAEVVEAHHVNGLITMKLQQLKGLRNKSAPTELEAELLVWIRNYSNHFKLNPK